MKFTHKIQGKKIEQFIGSMKFAVSIIIIFTIFMIVGTFIESYYGTDFANRIVYKTWPFILVQFLMLLSIIFAATLRMPPKKRLYGFYTIHSGLIIMGIGSIITYIAGVDGQITLMPNDPNRSVVLSKDIFKITYPDTGKQITTFLPYSAFKTSLSGKYDVIELKEFLPFSKGKFVWASPLNQYESDGPIQSSKYHFQNAFAKQDLILSIHPEASNEFQSQVNLGPLSFNYYPAKIARCFKLNSPSKLIIWNAITADCFTPEERKIQVKMTSSKNRFLVIPDGNNLHTFFPDFSPFPMDTNFNVNQNSTLRIFSKKMFEDKPTLFLFGKEVSYFDKSSSTWHTKEINVGGEAIDLPWMGAKITLIDHQTKLVPFNLPQFTIPIQKNGQLIEGDLRAVRVEILGKEYWITNYSPLSLNIEGKKVIMEVAKESITLPFEISLSEFKMDKDPGTNNPASYESFVKLFSDQLMTKHHIFMNHPMKHKGYTFYQASYGQDDNGNYYSTLAVNVDQGRWLKYLGSLMLVLGAIWHFNLNIKKKKE